MALLVAESRSLQPFGVGARSTAYQGCEENFALGRSRSAAMAIDGAGQQARIRQNAIARTGSGRRATIFSPALSDGAKYLKNDAVAAVRLYRSPSNARAACRAGPQLVRSTARVNR